MRPIRVLSVLFAVAAASLVANAQTFTKVKVHLPYTVVVGSKQLAPGDYELIPASASGNRFEIYSDGRDSFEGVVSAIQTWRVDPSQNTEIVLHDNGEGEYTLDQIWIQGSPRGYEFLAQKPSARAGESSPSSK
jgi:hypothetical protein